MRSSIFSMIQSVLKFRFMRAMLHSHLVLPLVQKYFCDSISFGIILSAVQNCRVLFSNYFAFALKRETNGFPQPLVYFLPYEREKMYHQLKHFRVSGIKISNVVRTKENSQILLQTLWHLWKSQINLVSLWEDSFIVVGYNVGQIEMLLGSMN